MIRSLISLKSLSAIGTVLHVYIENYILWYSAPQVYTVCVPSQELWVKVGLSQTETLMLKFGLGLFGLRSVLGLEIETCMEFGSALVWAFDIHIGVQVGLRQTKTLIS